jgi:thiamine-monophosphate kinase
MEKRTEISKLGEFGLINEIKKLFEPNKNTIGDDAAFIDAPAGLQLSSTELFIEGIHFDLGYMPLMHLGYKAVVAAISDIAAMNGIPSHILVSVGLSNRFSVEAVLELYNGIKVASNDYNLILAGGDTTASKSGLVLSITALGVAKSESLVKRQGAQPNDGTTAFGKRKNCTSSQSQRPT